MLPHLGHSILGTAICGHIIIPEGVTKLGKGSFLNCINLTNITIAESITYIDDYAFRGCDKLTSIHINNLQSWYNIYFVSYDSNPLYFGRNLYENYELVTNIVIPQEIKRINRYSFTNCINLLSIYIPNNVTAIEGWAFKYCSNLMSITIHDSVTSIGSEAFDYCTNLTDIYFTGTEKEWAAISKENANIPSNATIHYNYVPEN